LKAYFVDYLILSCYAFSVVEYGPTGGIIEPLLTQGTSSNLANLEEGRKQGLSALAKVKFFILSERYWSFYVSAFDGEDTLLGLMVTPDAAELCSQSLSELERVNVELDLRVERDPDFEPTHLMELYRAKWNQQ
jgi:hypothetical protein